MTTYFESLTATGCLVLVSCSSVQEAEKLSQASVEGQWAACASIVPGITSFYRWEGRLQKDAECLLILKTWTTRLPDLERGILALHSYQVPEFVVIPWLAASDAYASWVSQAVSSST